MFLNGYLNISLTIHKEKSNRNISCLSSQADPRPARKLYIAGFVWRQQPTPATVSWSQPLVTSLTSPSSVCYRAQMRLCWIICSRSRSLGHYRCSFCLSKVCVSIGWFKFPTSITRRNRDRECSRSSNYHYSTWCIYPCLVCRSGASRLG